MPLRAGTLPLLHTDQPGVTSSMKASQIPSSSDTASTNLGPTADHLAQADSQEGLRWSVFPIGRSLGRQRSYHSHFGTIQDLSMMLGTQEVLSKCNLLQILN